MGSEEEKNNGFSFILRSLFESAKGYLETYIDIIKLDFWEASTKILSSLIFMFISGTILFFAILILEISLALYIGEQNGHLWVGMVCVGVGNLLLVPILYLLHKKGIIHRLFKSVLENALTHDHSSVGK
jgi:hypothetical protein